MNPMSATNMRYDVVMLVAKYCKPFVEGEFIKYCGMKIVNICPENEQVYQCLLGCSTKKLEISDIKKQLVARGVNFLLFSV